MTDISNLIKYIKTRPLMYLEKEDLSCVTNYVNGYLLHSVLMREENEINDLYINRFPSWIMEWGKKNVNESKMENYAENKFLVNEVIKAVAGSEEEAMQLYYQLTEFFFEEISRECSGQKKTVSYTKKDLSTEQRENIRDVRTLIESIKKEPDIYIYEEKVDSIVNFVNGYLHTKEKKKENSLNHRYDYEFIKWLAGWIKKNRDSAYRFHTYYPCEMIHEITSSAKEAVELYYKLTEEFFAEVEAEHKANPYELYDLINKVKFKEAKKIFDSFLDCKKDDVTRHLAWDTKNILIYLFIDYVNKIDERVLYHEIAYDILTGGLSHIEGAYQLALFHNKRLIELVPNSIEYKEWMLFFYDVKVISKEDTKKLANDILKRDKNNKLANEILQRIE